MSKQGETPRDLFVRLVETVTKFLADAPSYSEDWSALEAAHSAVLADPLLVNYAEGNYDQFDLAIPRGCQITIIGPIPVER